MRNTQSKLSLTLMIGTAVTFLGACSASQAVGPNGTANSGASSDMTNTKAGAESMQQPHTDAGTTTPSGLKIEDIKVGQGETPRAGQTVVVHYTGWLTNGTKFDSSVDRGDPFKFPLGAGHVIKGWNEGVATMKVGGKRKLTIPPSLGYGARGAGGVIPPNATLVFDVELLGIEK